MELRTYLAEPERGEQNWKGKPAEKDATSLISSTPGAWTGSMFAASEMSTRNCSYWPRGVESRADQAFLVWGRQPQSRSRSHRRSGFCDFGVQERRRNLPADRVRHSTNRLGCVHRSRKAHCACRSIMCSLRTTAPTIPHWRNASKYKRWRGSTHVIKAVSHGWPTRHWLADLAARMRGRKPETAPVRSLYGFG
jgi:hypothetical protein